MIYRRRPYYDKQYSRPPRYPDSGSMEYTVPNLSAIKEIDKIPLPTEEEMEQPPLKAGAGNPWERISSIKRMNLSSIFKKLKSSIGIEEIILLGLLFILFEEGVDDDILIIVVLYILLSGRD